MPHSIPYRLSQAVVNALRAAPALAGAVVLDNPVDPAQLCDGDRVIFVEDLADRPIDRPGQAEGRSFSVGIGVISRATGARPKADADSLAAKSALQAALRGVLAGLVAERALLGFNLPREGERTYRAEGIDIGGAMVRTTYDIDYRTPAQR